MSILLVASFNIITAHSQVANEFQKSAPRMLAYNNLPGDEKIETVQKNFLYQIWRTGIVYSKNTLRTFELPLIFDVYSNKLYFLKDSFIMEFTEPVKQFSIPIVVKEDTVSVLYRSGYPAVHKNTDETFYEVLVDGSFQLLKCKAKTIALYKDKDVPEEDRDYSKELLYASIPNGHIILVKTDKDFLEKEIPEYKEKIQTICTDKKLKLKNEAQLKELFVELNKK
jgi:hypothetical protein